MSESVVINKEIEVNIYEVRDDSGGELEFSVDADSDGDLIITVYDTGINLEGVRDYLDDTANLKELLSNSCLQGRLTALGELVESLQKVNSLSEDFKETLSKILTHLDK